MMASHLSRFTFIPLMVNINPRNLPTYTPKKNLAGFKHMLYLMTNSKMSFTSVM